MVKRQTWAWKWRYATSICVSILHARVNTRRLYSSYTMRRPRILPTQATPSNEASQNPPHTDCAPIPQPETSQDPPHTGYTPAMQWRSRILPTQAGNYGMLQLKTCTCTSRFMKLLQQLIPTERIHCTVCNLFWPSVVCLRLPPLHCSHEVRRLSATVTLSRVNNC